MVEQAPGFPEVHYNLGFVNEKLGNTDKAREHYQTALQLRPGYFEANQAMGDHYIKQKDWSRLLDPSGTVVEEASTPLVVSPAFEHTPPLGSPAQFQRPSAGPLATGLG